jgi:hypothetical protein
MSSATSTEDRAAAPPPTAAEDGGLRPWQFFLLSGMLAATAVVLMAAGQSPASIIILSVTVVSASFVALGAYRSLAPLVVPEGGDAPPLIVGHTRAALEREKSLALRAIKDLEFDFAMKKIAKHDFDEMSARLRARAIGLMRQLDSGGGYKDAIERELAQRLGAASAPGAPGAPGAPSAPGAPGASGSARQEPSGELRRDLAEGGPSARSLCVCGTQNDLDARFCKTCGAKLTA